MVSNIRRKCSPLEIILFGSAARGEYYRHSDLDIALIFDTKEQAKQAQKDVLCSAPLAGVAVDYLFYDQKGFEKKKGIGGICEIIAREGRRRRNGSEIFYLSLEEFFLAYIEPISTYT